MPDSIRNRIQGHRRARAGDRIPQKLICRLHEDGHDTRTIQEVLGSADVCTTMTPTCVRNRGGRAVCSPPDGLWQGPVSPSRDGLSGKC